MRPLHRTNGDQRPEFQAGLVRILGSWNLPHLGETEAETLQLACRALFIHVEMQPKKTPVAKGSRIIQQTSSGYTIIHQPQKFG